ncbi:MAG: V-type ATP synthase subunit E [Candidatus Altiarchaeota archaeon]
MALNELKEKILSDADAQIEQVRKKGDAELGEVNERFKKRIEEESAEIIGKARRNAELSRREITGKAGVNGKVMVLEAKRRLLDDLFKEAEASVDKLSDADKKKIIARVLKDAEGFGDCIVHVAGEYRKLVPRKFKVKTADFTDFGIVIASSDGARKIDNRLPAVLLEARPRIEAELNKILWGGK